MVILRTVFATLLLTRSILCQVVTCNEEKDCLKEGADQCCSRFGFCGVGDGYCRTQIDANGKEVKVSTIETSCEIPGVEFVGFDLEKDLQGGGIKTDGAEECNFKCADIAECTHYTYDSSSKNEDEELCYLKYGRGETKSRGAGVVSGSTIAGGCDDLGTVQVPGPTVGGAPVGAASERDYAYDDYPDYNYLAEYCEDPYRMYGYGNGRYGYGNDYDYDYNDYDSGYGYGNGGRSRGRRQAFREGGTRGLRDPYPAGGNRGLRDPYPAGGNRGLRDPYPAGGNRGLRDPYPAGGNRGLRDPYPAGGNRGLRDRYPARGREGYTPNNGRRYGQGQGRRRYTPRQLEQQCLYYCDQQNPALGVYEYNMKRNFLDSQDFCRGIGGNLPYSLNQQNGGRFGKNYHWINYNPEAGQCLATRPGMSGNLALPCSSQLNFACQSNYGYPSQSPSLPLYSNLPGGQSSSKSFLELLGEMALAQDALGGAGSLGGVGSLAGVGSLSGVSSNENPYIELHNKLGIQDQHLNFEK